MAPGLAALPARRCGLPPCRAAAALPAAASLAAWAGALGGPSAGAAVAVVVARTEPASSGAPGWPRAAAGATGAACGVFCLAAAQRARRRLGRKAAEAVGPPAAERTAGTANGVLLAVLLYVSNVAFNVLNKQVLNVIPDCPLSNTVLHFGVGSVLSVVAWGLRLQRWPFPLSGRAAWNIAPLAVLHCVAILFTNIAVSKVSLSLVHTIKAAEPFYAAILSYALLGSVPSAPAVGALALIVLGVMGASVTEVSFNLVGFLAAMGSNLGFCLKNVLSKRLQVAQRVDELNLISLLTIGAFVLGLPLALLLEGPTLRAAAPPPALLAQAVTTGVLFHTYQIASILILYRASPVTHAVVNLMKRPALIIASVLFFGTAVSARNGLGVICALLGSYLYGRAVQKKAK